MNRYDLAYLLSIGPHYLWHRFFTDKYGEAVREKTGDVPDRFKSSATSVMGLDDPHYEPPCLWVHAVSVGEVNASVDLVRMFMLDNPRWELRVSTTTLTGRKVAARHFGEDRVFYYPLDFSWTVAKAFGKVRPSLVVLMELEIWPNFLAEAVRRSVPVVVANARISERSLSRLAWAPSVARSMAGSVVAWFAQTREYADRLEKIGVPPERIEVTGSVKYDAVPADVDEREGQYYRRLFRCDERFRRDGGKTLLVVAGSTHPGEERAVLEASRKCASKPGVRVVVALAPRHPERLDEVERLAWEYGSVARRSVIPEPTLRLDAEPGESRSYDVVLVDTMGELSKIYGAADLVFVGGSLAKHGGQNFIEPCGLAKPTIVGPNLWNFSEPADFLAGDGCMRIAKDDEGLCRAMAELADDPAKAADIGERARKKLLSRRGAAKRMVERLDDIARRLTRRR